MQGMLRDVIQVERRTAQSVLSLCTCAAGAQSSPNFRPDPGHCDSDELSVVGGGAVCADGAGFSLLCSATRPPLPLASSCLFGSFAFSSLAASCPNVNAWLVPAAVRRTASEGLLLGGRADVRDSCPEASGAEFPAEELGAVVLEPVDAVVRACRPMMLLSA